MPCTKRPYKSEHAVKRANASAGYRVLAYFCVDCRAWHSADGDKSRAHGQPPPAKRHHTSGRKRRSDSMRLPPKRTLTDLEALAAQMRGRSAVR